MTVHAQFRTLFRLTRCGWRPAFWLLTYAVIISEKVNRAIMALVGAGAMITIGVLDQEEAIKGVDWNTIGLLHRNDDSGLDLAPVRNV